ncbi:hypothetical protein WJX84_004296 [Apatococcus fuscideae]|uniref:Secreted protein n=1 Tax=Apatococcus fuscideae TaxID=2026836 RepID=A0AAW1S151_9CHLO
MTVLSLPSTRFLPSAVAASGTSSRVIRVLLAFMWFQRSAEGNLEREESCHLATSWEQRSPCKVNNKAD